MKRPHYLIISFLSLLAATPAFAHYDIAPYLQDGQLLTGGLDHAGNALAPTIHAFPYDFGEDPFDPYNPTDPGVNQQVGVGNLPVGALVRYNILSSMAYWDGLGTPLFTTPPAGAFMSLLMGTTARQLTGTSDLQVGTQVQTVAANGTLHKHFVASLFHDSLSSNVPGEANYVPPVDGIYAFQMELTLTENASTITSNPFWVVFNNNLTEAQHDLALEALTSAPEPASLGLLLLGTLGILARRKKA